MISAMAAVPEPSLILSFEEARHLVEAHAAHLRPRGKELVDLLEGAGQILAEPVIADRNFPPFPRAIRDGYAVKAADLAQLPATLDVVGEIKAGAGKDDIPVLQAGQSAAIMTGAPAPPGHRPRPALTCRPNWQGGASRGGPDPPAPSLRARRSS